jgi:hypothetical protein
MKLIFDIGRHLVLDQLGITPCFPHQLRVRANLRDLAISNKRYCVRVLDGRQTVSNDNRRAPKTSLV